MRACRRVRRAGTPGIDPGSIFEISKIFIFPIEIQDFHDFDDSAHWWGEVLDRALMKNVRTSAKTRETRASGRGGHAGTSGIDAGSIFEN